MMRLFTNGLGRLLLMARYESEVRNPVSMRG